MSLQEISELPQVPTQEDATNQQLFDQLMYAFLAGLPLFRTELNQLGVDLTTLSDSVDATAEVAVGLNNYQGVWAAGAFSQADSVFHTPTRGFYIANAATSQEPGAGADWQLIRYKPSVETIDADTDALPETLYVFDVPAAASYTLTLPSSPDVGDKVSIANLAEVTDCVIGRNGEKIHGVAEDLTVDRLNASFDLVYSGSSFGWVLK